MVGSGRRGGPITCAADILKNGSGISRGHLKGVWHVKRSFERGVACQEVSGHLHSERQVRRVWWGQGRC